MSITTEQVLEALKTVIDPDLHRDIVTLGFVKDVAITGGKVSLTIELTTPACPVKDLLKSQAESAVVALDGVTEAVIEMTAQVRSKQDRPTDRLPNVKHIIAIASGKGGVGKSTSTVNLAVALSQLGATVGILDADVYGPTVPLLMGVSKEKPMVVDQKIAPIDRFGIRVMSLGFLVEEEAAVMWRGPMVAGTLRQLLDDVMWGDLDYLLVDLPPGTGDAPMSIAQLAPLTGVVIISTPHQVASNIAGKSVALFRRLNTAILGIVENMGPSVNPETGEEVKMFAGIGGEALANQLKAPYLGSIPFDVRIGESGDSGVPSVLGHPNSEQAVAFRKVAEKIAQQASIIALTRQDVTRIETLV